VSRLIDIDDDGDEDLFIGYANGSIAFYRNTGTPDSAYFVLESECFQNLNGGGKCAPAFVDIDADGDFDLFTGYSPGLTGAVKLFENVGTPTNPSFVLRDDQYFYCDFGNVYPAVFDYDLDGDYDVVLGTQEGLIYYENIGTPQAPNYDFVTQNFFNIKGGIPYFYDIDHDNYPELFKGVLDSIYYYDSNNFIFTLVSTNWEQTAAHYWYAAPCLADIDNDGDGDLFVGSEDEGVTFWRNLYDSSAVHSNLFLSPTALTLHPCYPNPFNNETILPLELSERSNIRIDLYNIKGQLITTCYQGIENAGVVKIRVKGDDLASGVYFIKMTAEGLEKGTKFSDVGKILMLK
jgi:hypothetical protein